VELKIRDNSEFTLHYREKVGVRLSQRSKDVAMIPLRGGGAAAAAAAATCLGIALFLATFLLNRSVKFLERLSHWLSAFT
jgi:hypothetical protein